MPKTCRRCEQTKPSADFNYSTSAADGLQSYCRSCQVARNRELRLENPEPQRASMRRWRDANPEATKAHKAVKWAIKRGDLDRPSSCSRCDAEGRVEAHHENYERPLDVTWLCAMCHKAAHKEIAA